MKILGITGLARAGKDTTARFVQGWADAHGVTASRDGFADRLKASAAVALGYDGEQPVEFCDSLKREGVTVSTPFSRISGREFLQRYGTEAHRDIFGSSFWIDVLFDDYASGRKLSPHVLVIPDVRFPNEARAIKDRDGVIWKVERPEAGLSDGLEAHASEAGIGDILPNAIIHNDRDLRSLEQTVWALCREQLL